MNQPQTKKICLSCGSALHGRVDKKFCNDYCRNNYNNLQKTSRGGNELVKSINKALLSNRNTLEGLMKEGEGKPSVNVNKEKLVRLGFQFKYLTHLYTTKAGKTYYYCYDYGYLPLENDWFLVVKKSDHYKE